MAIFLEETKVRSKTNFSIETDEAIINEACYNLTEGVLSSEIAWQNMDIAIMKEEYKYLREEDGSKKAKTTFFQKVKEWFNKVIEWVKKMFNKVSDFIKTAYVRILHRAGLIEKFMRKIETDKAYRTQVFQIAIGNNKVYVKIHDWNSHLPRFGVLKFEANSKKDTDKDSILSAFLKSNELKEVVLTERLFDIATENCKMSSDTMGKLKKFFKNIEKELKDTKNSAEKGKQAADSKSEEKVSKAKTETVNKKKKSTEKIKLVSAYMKLANIALIDSYKIIKTVYKTAQKDKKDKKDKK